MEDNSTHHLPPNLEILRNLTFGNPVEILHNVHLIKVDKHQFRYGNMYIIQHPKCKSLLLIDAVRPESKNAVTDFTSNGYSIDGVLLTHSDLIGQAYGSFNEISTNLGGAPMYIHPQDIKPGWEETQDIMTAATQLLDYGIQVFHFPGHTPGSAVIYSSMNDGVVFSGDSAVGSNYEKEDYSFDRPPNDADEGLRECWSNFEKDFRHFLPLHGKPEFTLSRKRREEILRHLRKQEPTNNL